MNNVSKNQFEPIKEATHTKKRKKFLLSKSSNKQIKTQAKQKSLSKNQYLIMCVDNLYKQLKYKDLFLFAYFENLERRERNGN